MGMTPNPDSGEAVSGRSSQAIEDDGALYYIYASTSGKTSGDNITVLDEGSPTDIFVSRLNDDQTIVLSSTPSPTASLDNTDETLQWIQNLDSIATGSITVDQANAVESFSLELQQPWKMTFSSTAEVLLYTFGPGIGTDNRIPPPGIEASGQMLTLGLDFQQTVDVSSNNTLKDLFEQAGAAGMVDYVPSKLLDLAVTLEPPAERDHDPKRIAIWYVPASSKRIVMRLQFQVLKFNLLQDVLGTTLPGFTLKSANVIFYKDVLLAATETGPEPLFRGSIAFSVECSVEGGGSGEIPATAAVDLSESCISLTFMFESENDPLSGILKWLASLIGDDGLESLVTGILGNKEGGNDVFPHHTLRRMMVTLDTKDPENRDLSSFSFDIEVSVNIGSGSDSKPNVFLLSYNWDRFTGGLGQLTGQLWTGEYLPSNVPGKVQGKLADIEPSVDVESSQDLDLLPHQEKWTILLPVTTGRATSISIASLIPGQTVVNIPDTLPSEVTDAYLALTQTSFDIRCSVEANRPVAGSVPQPYLGEVALEGSFNWGESSSFALGLFISAGIEPSEENAADNVEPAILQGLLTYDSSKKEWQLKGTLTGLYASTLVEFFDDDDKAHVGPLINSIVISTLDVQYTYTGASGGGTSTGSEFLIDGNLLIAGLSLKLNFNYKKGEGFTFKATLNPDSPSATIGDVLASILGTTDIELPDFVYNTQLNSEGEDLFSLEVSKKESSFLFASQLSIAKVHIDFAQMHRTEWRAGTPSKRLFRVSINGFPNREVELPLIGSLTQPLDELCFLWVQDPAPAAAGKMNGLLRSDLTAFNSGLQDPILIKDKIKPESQTEKDLLLAAGCHFSVIIRSSTGERSCLLDYEFMKPSASTSSSKALQLKQGAKKDEPGDDGSPSAQAPYKKTAGPLSISNVGLKYKDKQLAIMFDATFQLGPLGFSLVGFSLGFNFTTLTDPNPVITPAILGLAASFEQPPLSIAGVIRHGNEGGLDYYAGGLVVGWKPYQFEAAGFYGIVVPPGGADGFKSVFIFAKLNGPLVTLEFAEIDSLCGGFGYNSSVRLPTVDEVYEFPFIANAELGGSVNAMEVLEKLVDPSGGGGWFKPLDKTYWLAVGMGIGAFQMMNIDAVVVVQFGSAIKLGIFAVATADIPTPASSFKLAHVELGISAIADFDYGTLKIDAQLSPRSYILDPNCHLTGGFGLYYWFDAPHADSSVVGQYVFTLGGYHQAYNRPVGFPNPPRLGISWNLGGGLTVSGQAYFAITPKSCMAGGRLHAAFAAGPLSAWFDAFADFLINYKPFYFNMQAGLSVGVGFSIDVWFIHIRISVEIGAQLYLWGPPVAGRVHVDFWIVSFDINFGSDKPRDEAVSLLSFYQLVLQSRQSASSFSATWKPRLGIASRDADDGIVEVQESYSRPPNEGHNFLAQSGLLNPVENPERNQNADWIVRAGSFSFVVECKMAISAVKDSLDAKDPVITYGDVYSRPMKLTNPMSSTLSVEVQQEGQDKPDEGWQYDKYLKSLPRALWAQYDSSSDPRTSGNNIRDLLNSDGGAMTLMAGAQITAPKPTMSLDPFPAYEVADADLQRLLSERTFPEVIDADDAWAPDQRPADGNVQGQYDAVLDAWSEPALEEGDGGRQGFVGVLAGAFKWAVAGEMKSIAGIPERLKNGFMDLYVAAPLLTK
ncbi:hypothetical protein E0Z10_g925 [Xylaria hypoxylon]|uniref:DUF6603 domain-containing protein n=1 Tax=Xylaria hypoxylon TaxID=37992 RepID=A0A4Z0Z8C8_9PEZI|nr:hypothetical protein E0Z10_g925 [Xylaria hypoxylon]